MPINKKAQTAIGLIPLVALLLGAAALLALLSFKGDFQSQSTLLSEMMEEIEFNHQYVLAQASLISKKSLKACPSCSSEQLKQTFKEISLETEQQYRHEEAGNFFGKIRNDEFEILDNKLTINDLFIESQRGRNKIKRAFDIEILLNS